MPCLFFIGDSEKLIICKSFYILRRILALFV